MDIKIQDRARGALLGAFVGDALGLGPHWYYDLHELRKDYGEWIEGYTDPSLNVTKPDCMLEISHSPGLF
jgi:ADP-ribosylglycohydrolase